MPRAFFRPITVFATAVVVGGSGYVLVSRLHRDATRIDPPVQVVTPMLSEPAEPGLTDTVARLRLELDALRRRDALRRWADDVRSEDMPARLAWLLSVKPASWRAELREALFYSWTGRDLVAVAEWFGRPGGAQELRQEGRDQLVAALRQCAAEEVVAALNRALPPAVSRELFGPYFRDWASVEPAAAGALLVRLSAGLKSRGWLWDDLAAQVAGQWAVVDPMAAAAWVETWPEGRGRTQAALQLSYGWVERDPAAAAAYAMRSGDLRVLATVAGKWAETDPTAAAVWAEALPAGLPRERAVAGAVAIWGQNDPAAAAAYAAALGDPNLRAEAVAVAVAAWAFAEPEAASRWVAQLPEDGLRERARRALRGETKA